MQKKLVSAGLLIYRFRNSKLEVFLVHPGGPFWKNKDEGAWSIPKGEIDDGESLLDTAIREINEETGVTIDKSTETFVPLENVRLKSGKIVHAWGIEGDWSGLLMCKSYVKIEWPLKSGKHISFPEVDKAGFFKIDEARLKMNPAQALFLDRLKKVILSK